MSTEELLPREILAKASLRGKEYAWRQDDTTLAILAAKDANLATLGGEVQFRLPESIVEFYWLNFDPASRGGKEAWSEYVSRSADDCIKKLDQLCRSNDFVEVAKEGHGILREMAIKGDVAAYLCFVLYFVTEEQYNHLGRHSEKATG